MSDWIAKVHFENNLQAVLGEDMVWRIHGGSPEDGAAMHDSLAAVARSLNIRYGAGSPDMQAGPESGAPGRQAAIAAARSLQGRLEFPVLPAPPPPPPGLVN